MHGQFSETATRKSGPEAAFRRRKTVLTAENGGKRQSNAGKNKFRQRPDVSDIFTRRYLPAA